MKILKTYNYILFDWDGCLAKSLDLVLQAYKDTFSEYGIYPDDKTITQEVFGDWNGPKKIGVQNIQEYTDKFLARVNEDYPYLELYEYAREVVLELKKRNKKLALITTSKKSTLSLALENTKMSQLFDVILTAEDVVKHKPDPEIIEKALVSIGGKKDEAIIIGDSKSDLGAAQNAGIDSLLYYPKHNETFYDLETLKTYNPTHIVNDFRKVLDIV